MKSVLSSQLISICAAISILVGSLYYFSDTVKNHVDDSGMRQGHWVITGSMVNNPDFESDDIVEEGSYENDKKAGIWNKFYPDGKIRSQITYKNDKPIGEYTLYYDNGIVEESGNWQRNKNIGEFQRNYSNGNPHQRFAFSDSGKRNGKQTYFHENGSIALLVELVNGKESGIMKRYDEKGELSEEKSFDNGQFIAGTTKSHQELPEKFIPPPAEIEKNSDVIPSPPKSEESETNSAHHFQQNGHNILYDKNNSISQTGFFKEGKLWNGKWFKYNVNGILLRVDIYRNGKFIGHGVLEQE